MSATVRPEPDLTPTERAVTRARAVRAAACYPLAGDEWLILGALDQAEAEVTELRAKLASAEKHAWQMDDVIDSLGIPGAATAVTA